MVKKKSSLGPMLKKPFLPSPPPEPEFLPPPSPLLAPDPLVLLPGGPTVIV